MGEGMKGWEPMVEHMWCPQAFLEKLHFGTNFFSLKDPLADRTLLFRSK